MSEPKPNPEAKLKELKIHLTEPVPVEGAYVPCVKTGNLLFISGQLPKVGPHLAFKGRLGKEISLDNGKRAAKQALANALSVAKYELGNLDRIKRVVRLTGYVNSYPGFIDQAKVMDAASELLGEVFGEAGKHTRVSVGVTDLPLLATVEIDLILEVK
jgi:enamine deaminase RidA (YjgF/YER057c/UK114 family)